MSTMPAASSPSPERGSTPSPSARRTDLRRGVWRFLRFGIVGATCFACGLLSVWLLTDALHWHYLVSTAVSLIGVNALGWLLNRTWTFKVRADRSWLEFARYAFVNAAGMALTLGLMSILVSGLGWHYVMACASVGALMMVVNFGAHALWSLRPQRVPAGAHAEAPSDEADRAG